MEKIKKHFDFLYNQMKKGNVISTSSTISPIILLRNLEEIMYKDLIKYQNMNYPENTKKIFEMFNNAVNSMYALDIEWAIDSLNPSIDFEEMIKPIMIDSFDIACKLEKIRDILLGEAINWEELCKKIKEDDNERK
jgi:hypothetical protein